MFYYKCMVMYQLHAWARARDTIQVIIRVQLGNIRIVRTRENILMKFSP